MMISSRKSLFAVLVVILSMVPSAFAQVVNVSENQTGAFNISWTLPHALTTDFIDAHIWVSMNNSTYKYLGKTVNNQTTYVWGGRNQNRRVAAEFANGPIYGQTYRFNVYLNMSNVPISYQGPRNKVGYLGPFSNAQPAMLQDVPNPVQIWIREQGRILIGPGQDLVRFELDFGQTREVQIIFLHADENPVFSIKGSVGTIMRNLSDKAEGLIDSRYKYQIVKRFILDGTVRSGEFNIFAEAVDSAGNKSRKTIKFRVGPAPTATPTPLPTSTPTATPVVLSAIPRLELNFVEFPGVDGQLVATANEFYWLNVGEESAFEIQARDSGENGNITIRVKGSTGIIRVQYPLELPLSPSQASTVFVIGATEENESYILYFEAENDCCVSEEIVLRLRTRKKPTPTPTGTSTLTSTPTSTPTTTSTLTPSITPIPESTIPILQNLQVVARYSTITASVVSSATSVEFSLSSYVGQGYSPDDELKAVDWQPIVSHSSVSRNGNAWLIVFYLFRQTNEIYLVQAMARDNGNVLERLSVVYDGCPRLVPISTNTPVLPTATLTMAPTMTPTVTNTPVPPVPTSTAIVILPMPIPPATATNTPVPLPPTATRTLVPPTATHTKTPTPTPSVTSTPDPRDITLTSAGRLEIRNFLSHFDLTNSQCVRLAGMSNTPAYVVGETVNTWSATGTYRINLDAPQGSIAVNVNSHPEVRDGTNRITFIIVLDGQTFWLWQESFSRQDQDYLFRPTKMNGDTHYSPVVYRKNGVYSPVPSGIEVYPR